MSIEAFIATFKNLEVSDLSIPLSKKQNVFHRRIRNKEKPQYFIDYWHSGRFRAIDGEFLEGGVDNKYLFAEIKKLAEISPKESVKEVREAIGEIKTYGELVTFGKHKGERWTRIPVSYLKWLVNESSNWRETALAELKRRGTTLSYEVEISGHAIDRASLNCRKTWHETAEDGEGIHAWLVRMATEAIGSKGKQELIHWKGVKLAFTYGEYYPILKTVMPSKQKETSNG